MVHPDGKGYPVRSIHKGKWVYMYNFDPDRDPCGPAISGYHDTDSGPTKMAILKHKKTKAFELCFGKRPQEELYNIEEDPECQSNLAEDKQLLQLKKEMKTELFAILEAQKDPRILGDTSIFDYVPKHLSKKFDKLVKKAKKTFKNI